MLVTSTVAILGWVVAAIGWWVGHRTSVRRANRQEDLAMIGEIQGRVRALRQKAVEYHTGPSVGVSEESAFLRYEIKSIIAAVINLRVRKPEFYNLTSELKGLRTSITGGSFDSGKRQALLPEDPFIDGIWAACETLTDRLRDEFEKAN